jgi:pyruvate,orthophosphate dikinase
MKANASAEAGPIARFFFPVAPHAPLVGPEELGFKAHNLLRLARMGLAVPEAFVIGTSACKAYFADRDAARAGLRGLLREALAPMEQSTGLGFGSERRPLLLSVRSGAPVSMPGMLDTLLDIGLCDQTLRGLLRLTGNPRLVWDSYRRLVQSFAEIVHRVEPAPFRARLAERVKEEGLASARELDYRSLADLTRDCLDIYADLAGRPFPQDPYEQLETAVVAVFESWNGARARAYRRMHGIAEGLGTSVTVQRMVFGNAGGTSGAGVAFTRDPSTGENTACVDFLFNCQGEDIVSGRTAGNDAERMASALPGVAAQLAETRRRLELEFGDMQEFEFTVEEGRLYLLQTRTAKRTPWAALRIAVELSRAGSITAVEALARLREVDLRAIQRVRLADRDGLQPLARGTPVGLGVAVGRIALDAAAAKRIGRARNPVILVREDISTDDVPVMANAAGVLTARGSRTAHAAVVARQLGKPCVVGCGALVIGAHQLTIGQTTLAEGEEICIDAESGEIFAGHPRLVVDQPSEYLQEVERWRAQAAA